MYAKLALSFAFVVAVANAASCDNACSGHGMFFKKFFSSFFVLLPFAHRRLLMFIFD